MKFWQFAAMVGATACLVSPLATPAAASPRRAALFPVEFDDSSLQPPTADEVRRVAAVGAALRTQLAASGRYVFVDTHAVDSAADQRELFACHGCEAPLARQVGAQLSVVAWVQKVSNLILNINAVIRDVATGAPVAAGSVDIRGNTDESWSRGVRYLVQHRLLAAAAP